MTALNPDVVLSTIKGNNTSAFDSYRWDSSNSGVRDNFVSGSSDDKSYNRKTGAVSREPVSDLLYSGAITKTWAVSVDWWNVPALSGHKQNGLVSNSQAQMDRQIADIQARGIYGWLPTWYGEGDTATNIAINAAILKGKAACEAQSLPFWLLFDHGGYDGADPTQQIKDGLLYAYTNFFQSARYYKESGRPLIAFFGDELEAGTDWNSIATYAAASAGNPIFIFRNKGGLVRGAPNVSGGAFAWHDANSSNNDQGGTNYLTDFYNYVKANKAAGQTIMGSCYKGFDDTLAGWGTGKHTPQRDGLTWLDTIAVANAQFSAASQLPHLLLVTWNDYEEGSEIETGIHAGVSLDYSIAGSVVFWTLLGTLPCHRRIRIYGSLDGVNGELLHEESAINENGFFDLDTLGLDPGAYSIYLNAVAVSSVRNFWSSALTYSVPESGDPADYVTPLRESYSTRLVQQIKARGRIG